MPRVRLILFAFAIHAGCAGAVTAGVVDPTTYPLGATVVPPAQGGGVVFRVWAPNATAVSVPGQFNGWNTAANPMTLEGPSDIWSTWVPTATEGQEYKFYITAPGGPYWRIDPRARDTVNSLGNAVIRGDGSAYPWAATGWQTPDHDRMVIYEMHIGTFSGNGDGVPNYPATFRDAVDNHLDELGALGVNMVEVMPIHEFPGGVSWGYNPVHLYAPESDHGAPDDFRYFVDQMHQAGIGVILDVVYNHMSPSDLDLWTFDGPANIYFFGINCQGETPWGHTRPRYTETQVRDWITDNVRHWFEEYRIDGMRVDATQFMRNYCGEMGEGWTLMGAITQAARAVNPRAIMIAEELPNTGAVTDPIGSGGAGFDAQWCDLFNDTFRAEMATIASGGDPSMAALANAIANSGFGGPNSEAVKYVESHDEAATGGRISAVIDPANAFSARAVGLSKVVTGLTLLSPGIPMLLQGQEMLEDKPFDDGFGDRVWWGFLNTYAGVRDFHSLLCDLRRQRGALRSTSPVQITHVNDGAEVLAFQRYDLSGDVIFVVANFSATDFTSYLVGVPQPGDWHELANSQLPAHGGAAASNGTRTATATPRDGLPATLDLSLPAHSLLVLSQNATVPAGLTGFMVN